MLLLTRVPALFVVLIALAIPRRSEAQTCRATIGYGFSFLPPDCGINRMGFANTHGGDEMQVRCFTLYGIAISMFLVTILASTAVTQSVPPARYRLATTTPAGWQGPAEKRQATKIFEATHYYLAGVPNSGYNKLLRTLPVG